MRETWIQSLGWEDPWRRAWQLTPVFLPGESPWTEVPGGLQSMGSQSGTWLINYSSSSIHTWWGFPSDYVVKNLPANIGGTRFDPWVRKISWRRKWQPILVFSPGKYHGQRSLEGCNSWGCKGVGHNLATKQQQHTYMISFLPSFIVSFFMLLSSSYR